jgi:hypothetical protein
MLTSVYPIALRSVAADVDTRPWSYQKRMALWVLDVAGPFCAWTAPPRYSGSEYKLQDRVSALLGLSATCVVAWPVLQLQVQVTQAYLDRVIHKVYRKETAA